MELQIVGSGGKSLSRPDFRLLCTPSFKPPLTWQAARARRCPKPLQAGHLKGGYWPPGTYCAPRARAGARRGPRRSPRYRASALGNNGDQAWLLATQVPLRGDGRSDAGGITPQQVVRASRQQEEAPLRERLQSAHAVSHSFIQPRFLAHAEPALRGRQWGLSQRRSCPPHSSGAVWPPCRGVLVVSPHDPGAAPDDANPETWNMSSMEGKLLETDTLTAKIRHMF